MRTCAVLLALTVSLPVAADPMNDALDALVAAYPDHLVAHEGNDLIWKDGTRMPIADGRADKTFQQLLEHPDIKDQFAFRYPLGPNVTPPAVNEDPGRIRFEPFFAKMYGDCRKGEVTPKLRAISWLPHHGGGMIRATTINGVADQLEKVSRDLDLLPAAMIQYLVPMSGTYNCRPIAETHRLSVHAFGAAIDINARFGNYWLWSKGPDGAIAWRNQIPKEIVEIFERYGFIWGGRWYHFDSLHFEYRPELIALAKQGWPRD